MHGHLSFTVGTKVRQHAVLSHLGKTRGKPMGKRYRKRHKLLRLVAGISEHHTLIARAYGIVPVSAALSLYGRVHAHSYIGRLALDIDYDIASRSIEAERRVVISRIGYRLARHSGIIDIRARCHLAEQIHILPLAARLHRYAAELILAQ